VLGAVFSFSPTKFGEKFWRAHLLMRRKFSAVHEHCPPENLLFAIRYSPLAASTGWVAKFAGGCDNLLAG
jgi:hypothetical protein